MQQEIAKAIKLILKNIIRNCRGVSKEKDPEQSENNGKHLDTHDKHKYTGHVKTDRHVKAFYK